MRRRLHDLWLQVGKDDEPPQKHDTPAEPDHRNPARLLLRTPARLWRIFGFGLMRATAPLRTKYRSGEPVPARAKLESAKISERYFYHQHISLNDYVRADKEPSGEIELILPYDGEEYFTRQAHQDVRQARKHGADHDGALVGFLAFSDYDKTNLGAVIHLDDNHGSYPIEMRLPQESGTGEPDPLLSDDSSCTVTVTYEPRPQSRQTLPVRLDVGVRDRDNADIWMLPGVIEEGFETNIMRQIEFIPELTLVLKVAISLPSKIAAGATATVKEVFVGWPTRTSLSSLRLEVAGEEQRFWYDPERAQGGGLVWRDVPLTARPETGGDIRTFGSEPMTLFISKPGDLYRQESIDGQVDVSVDRLLSGADARLFDATGKRSTEPACELETVIETKFDMTLDDAFARRVQSPYQQMHFDEVILTKARIDDINTALRNRGFTVTPLGGQEDQKTGEITDRWLSARRPEKADRLSLLLYVAGKRYRTRRQRQVDGGIAYQTTIESGELQIYVYGFLRGDSKTAVQEMNALRRALRERFDRLPARR